MVVGNQVVQGKTTACAGCHGPDLMGKDDVPPLAGRSPSYPRGSSMTFSRARATASAAPFMRPVVANLTHDDMVAITAYLASVGPGAPATLPRC